VSVTGSAGGDIEYVDQKTAFDPPAKEKSSSDSVALGGYSVAVVTLP
jgi:hypothetical protein